MMSLILRNAHSFGDHLDVAGDGADGDAAGEVVGAAEQDDGFGL